MTAEEVAAEYDACRQNTDCPWCWACGRSDRDRPADWGGPWLIERAHIVSQPRRRDTRHIVLLCSRCHRLSHGDRFRVGGDYLPQLSQANLVELKRVRDATRYDRASMASCCVGSLPRAAKLPQWFRDEYNRRRARYEIP